jgi:chromosome segregation ATPase
MYTTQLKSEEITVSEPNFAKGAVPRSRAGSIAVPVLWGLVIALICASAYLFLEIDRLRSDIRAMRSSVSEEVAKVRESSSLLDSANRRNLDQLRLELETAQRAAAAAAGQAKTDALRHAEEIARKLEAEQQRQQQQIAGELHAVREAASAANSKIADVSTEVSTVRSEVASTRSELDKTIAELKSVRGDLGVQSGLIATNAKELAALRSLGDRNYFEFNLTRGKAMQRVGDVSMRLTRVDVKKNKYTLELIADDKKVEKKDRNINEPLQFYVSRVRQPYEIVVNEVRKDQIVGYLATPKVQPSR